MEIPCYETVVKTGSAMPGGLNGDVHAWLVDLNDQDELPDRWPLLDGDETARARRFVFAADRNRYVAAHAALRLILSGYLAVPPGTIRYRTTGNGKPCLDADRPAVRFNLSHSGNMALVAVSDAEVGADIERMNPDRSYLGVAERFFSPVDQARLRGSTKPVELFYTLWSAREAVLKASGAGLFEPFDPFTCVEGRPGPDGRLPADGLCAFSVDSEYRCSVFPVKAGQRLSFFRVRNLSQWR